MIPYGRKIVSDYLRAHPSVAAMTSHVQNTRPGVTAQPFILVRQIDAVDRSGISDEHLIEFHFDLHCYAGDTGGSPESILLGRTVRAAVVEMPRRETDSSAVVTSAKITGDIPLADDDLSSEKGVPRDRQIISAAVHMHP